MFTTAITRLPGNDFAQGLTSAGRGPPDYNLCLQQHAAYVDTLKRLGLQVIELEPQPGFPDACFVEDVAVVTPEIAVITRPGVQSRRGETAFIESALEDHRKIMFIENPGTLEGGDVMIVGKNCYVGISQRTNARGAEQLHDILESFGYTTHAIEMNEGLHLKSDVNYVDEETLVVTNAMSQRSEFADYKKIAINKNERYAANIVRVNDGLIIADGFPDTAEQLGKTDYPIIALNVSEFEKMDGGLTCLSLRF